MQAFVKRSLVAGVGAVALGVVALHFAKAADMEVPKEDFQGYAQGDEQGAPPAPLPRKYQGRPYQEAVQPRQGYYGPPEEESYAYEQPPVYGYAPPSLAYAYPVPRYVVAPVFAPPYYVRGPFWHGYGYGPHFAYGYSRVGFGRFGHGWHR
jgi:hypothetical protein